MADPIVIITPGPKPTASAQVGTVSGEGIAVFNQGADGVPEVVAKGFHSHDHAYAWLHGFLHAIEHPLSALGLVTETHVEPAITEVPPVVATEEAPKPVDPQA